MTSKQHTLFDPKIENVYISNLLRAGVIFRNFSLKCFYRGIFFLIDLEATGVTKKT